MIAEMKAAALAQRHKKGLVFRRVANKPRVKLQNRMHLVPEFDWVVSVSGTEQQIVALIRCAENRMFASMRGVVTYRGDFWQVYSDRWVARLSVTDLNGRYMISPGQWSKDPAPFIMEV